MTGARERAGMGNDSTGPVDSRVVALMGQVAAAATGVVMAVVDGAGLQAANGANVGAVASAEVLTATGLR